MFFFFDFFVCLFCVYFCCCLFCVYFLLFVFVCIFWFLFCFFNNHSFLSSIVFWRLWRVWSFCLFGRAQWVVCHLPIPDKRCREIFWAQKSAFGKSQVKKEDQSSFVWRLMISFGELIKKRSVVGVLELLKRWAGNICGLKKFFPASPGDLRFSFSVPFYQDTMGSLFLLFGVPCWGPRKKKIPRRTRRGWATFFAFASFFIWLTRYLCIYNTWRWSDYVFITSYII